jgi:hypothetical protein
MRFSFLTFLLGFNFYTVIHASVGLSFSFTFISGEPTSVTRFTIQQ